MKSISLASKSGGPCCAPTSVNDIYYPTFHYSGDTGLDLPDEGEMTIKFRRVEESERTDRDGKCTYSCTVEVKKILSVDGKDTEIQAPASNPGKETEDALDALRAALYKSPEGEVDGEGED